MLIYRICHYIMKMNKSKLKVGKYAKGDTMRILLAEQMERKGLSYRQLEILTGISKSTLHNIATGKRIPRMDTIEKLAEHLHVKIEDLYESEYK